jgi:hypothetical protein
MTSQQLRVAIYLRNHGELNPLTAWLELGVYRLSAVILELRKKGFSIRTDRKSALNKFDEKCCFANYVLENKNDDNKREN